MESRNRIPNSLERTVRGGSAWSVPGALESLRLLRRTFDDPQLTEGRASINQAISEENLPPDFIDYFEGEWLN